MNTRLAMTPIPRPPTTSESTSNSDISHTPAKTFFKPVQDQEFIRTSLLKSSFFSCMDDEQLNSFIQSVELKQYPQGQIIILEGCTDSSESAIDGSFPHDGENVLPTQPHCPEAVAFANEHLSSVTDDDTLVEAADDEDGRSQQKFGEKDSISESSLEPEVDCSSSPSNENVDENSLLVDPCVTRDEISNVFSVDQNTTASCLGLSAGNLTVPVLSTLTEIVRPPIPPQSGVPRSIYIIRKGFANVYYQNPYGMENYPFQNGYPVNTIGPGTLFGEGGFLFGRQHSASIIASMFENHQNPEPLECWVMDIRTFRDHVLPSSKMRQIFSKYARTSKEEPNVEAFMSMDDFLNAIKEHHQIDGNGSSNYFTLATTLHDSLIRLRLIKKFNDFSSISAQEQEPKFHLNDFCFFFFLLARPDPEVDIAFLLMDENRTGQIGLHDIEAFLLPVFPDLDFQSQFFQRYFGVDGNQCIRSTSFSQFLIDLQREIGQQAYIRAVQQNSNKLGALTGGFLSPDDFVNILTTSCGWRLPTGIESRLKEVCCSDVAKIPSTSDGISSTNYLQKRESKNEVSLEELQKDQLPQRTLGEHYFSFGDFIAFQEVLGNLPFLCNLISRVQDFKGGPISSDDFKVANRALGLGGRVSRRQVEILFQLFDLDHDGYISHADTVKVCGTNFTNEVFSASGRVDRLSPESLPQVKLNEGHSLNDYTIDLVQRLTTNSIYFGMAMIVGALSVGVLHPLELIKTRLMNQRFGHNLRYSGPFDCLRQVIRNEGWLSLFRGVQPQLLGVAIERSIKLQVHHLLQQAFHFNDEEKDEDTSRGSSLWLEAVAGGCAGACQLLITNPMEITSIRLQMQGETAQLLKLKGIVPPPPSNLWGVVQDLGFPGVYRGASACLLRDIPFSAIYFPTYMACKDALVATTYNGKPTPSEILLAGTMAGIPAALLTTPADVVKCRLQSIARPGEATYGGIQDCATKIYQQEGIQAFFRGTTMRVLRIAPQFGLSLTVYESLVSALGFEKAKYPPTNLPVDPQDYRVAFPRESSSGGFIQRWLR